MFSIYTDYAYEEFQRTCKYELLVLTYHVIFVSLSIKKIIFTETSFTIMNLSNIHDSKYLFGTKKFFAPF